MSGLLSDQAIDILKRFSGRELLRLSKRIRTLPSGDLAEYLGASTAVFLDDGIAL